MAAMNEQPGKAPVMIFAGYTGDMDKFMCANEGLYRRIGYTFDFNDYSPGADGCARSEFLGAEAPSRTPCLPRGLVHPECVIARILGGLWRTGMRWAKWGPTVSSGIRKSWGVRRRGGS